MSLLNDMQSIPKECCFGLNENTAHVTARSSTGHKVTKGQMLLCNVKYFRLEKGVGT